MNDKGLIDLEKLKEHDDEQSETAKKIAETCIKGNLFEYALIHALYSLLLIIELFTTTFLFNKPIQYLAYWPP